MTILRDMRFWIAIGLICLSLFLWLATGLITTGEPPAPLSVTYRLIFLLVLFAAIGSLFFAVHLSSQRSNATVLQDISGANEAVDGGSHSDPSMLTEEESQLRAKFAEAAAFLKKKRFGQKGKKQHLYQLPWYIVIGSPGSGKTTAIRHSGLDFPLDELTSGNSLGGVGGTRNCDWWITNQAVLLDTAGRYTTQDSDASYDARGWKNFLDLLKKNRKKQPINGAVLVVSTDELLRMSDQEWKQHTQTVTKRLRELVDYLNMDFPVYLLVTKVDLLAGCREFFDSLDVDEQDQIWGTTLAPDAGVESLDSELQGLAKRLYQQTPTNHRLERDTKRRQAIYSFPSQMETLSARLNNFVSEVFSRQGVKEHTQFRGLYFTSAVQEGTPIERLFASVTSGFGISGSVSTQQQKSRSLFLKKLFPDVIFSEAFLAGTNTAHDLRMQRLRHIAFGCIILAAAGLAFIWTGAFTIQRGLVSEAKDNLTAFQQSLHGPDVPLTENLASLQYLDSAAGVFDQQNHPWLYNLGMYDGSVDEAAKSAYLRTLQTVLAPALGNEVASWLAGYNSPDYQENFDALKAYLMLGNRERRKDEWLLEWLADPPITNLQLEQQEAIVQHMGALLEQDPEYQLPVTDEVTIKRTRNLLSQVSPSEAVYSRIKSMYAGEITDLRPELGPYFSSVFEARDENGLTVPSLYTVGGYQTINFGMNSEAMMTWLEDRWVLGQEGIPTPAELTGVVDGVKRMYGSDYIAAWRSVMADIDLLVPSDTAGLSDTMGHLAEPALSPMSALLKLVTEETSLPEKSVVNEAAVAAATDIAKRKTGKLGRAVDKIGVSGAMPETFDIPADVSRSFAPYHDMLRGGVGSRDARVAMEIGEVRQWLNVVQHSPEAATANNPSRKLLLTAQDLAEPFSGWVASLARGAQNSATSKKVGQLNARWQTEVVTPCKRALNSRFPFSGGARSEVSLIDFEDFFGPDGIEESFVKEYLNPLIKKQDGTVSRATVWSIRQAERIREAFFDNGRDLGFTYNLQGVEVDDRIGQLIIESGSDQRVRFRHGPPVPMELQWPDGDKGLKITFMLKDGTVKKQTIEGSWAIFRAVANSGGKRSASVDSQLVSFSDGDYRAIFRITSDSRISPFLPGLLDKYSCRPRL